MNAALARAFLDVAARAEALRWELEFGDRPSPYEERIASEIRTILTSCRSALRAIRAADSVGP